MIATFVVSIFIAMVGGVGGYAVARVERVSRRRHDANRCALRLLPGPLLPDSYPRALMPWPRAPRPEVVAPMDWPKVEHYISAIDEHGNSRLVPHIQPPAPVRPEGPGPTERIVPPPPPIRMPIAGPGRKQNR